MKTTNLIKYESKNPIQQFFIKRFYRKVVSLLRYKSIKSVADIGCGEGFGLSVLAENKIGKTYIGLDNSATALKVAKKIHPRFKYLEGSIYNTPFKDNSFDLVVCSEVLEHLEKPEQALAELSRISKKYVLISVPYEPWFRTMNFLRGKYLSSWGNHPEHIQWWGMRKLNLLLTQNFKVKAHISSIPLQIALCEVSKKKA